MAAVGDKYVIEIGEVYESRIDVFDEERANAPTALFRIKGFNSLVFDKYGLDKLEKYEAGAYERGVKDAQEIAIRNGKEAIDKAYQLGLSDAWAAARKLTHVRYGGYDDKEKNTIFGRSNSDDILTLFTAAEAIEKIRAYEERKKAEEEIKVGDEVITPGGNKVVVTEINGKVMYGISAYGVINACAIDNAQKTGRHFSQVAELLEQMKE